MISKNTIKLIKSLATKKNRIRENLFLVEGDKNVAEVLKSDFVIENIFATHEFLYRNKSNINKVKSIVEVTENEIQKASLLKSPQNSIAICSLPSKDELPGHFDGNLSIYLDGIQDPGNLGTIIRICDWFGIDQIFCSPDTADVFNPKVIQSSMGSFCRIRVYQVNYHELIAMAKKSEVEILGAFIDGDDIYANQFPHKTLIVLGNEGNGIREELERKMNKKIKIPAFSKNPDKAESLNVSVAAAIICSEFMRQQNYSK